MITGAQLVLRQKIGALPVFRVSGAARRYAAAAATKGDRMTGDLGSERPPGWPPPPPPPGYRQPQRPPADPLAVVALVAGAAGLAAGLWSVVTVNLTVSWAAGFVAVAGVILGCVALGRIRRHRTGGRPLGIVAIVLGGCWAVVLVALLVAVIVRHT